MLGRPRKVRARSTVRRELAPKAGRGIAAHKALKRNMQERKHVNGGKPVLTLRRSLKRSPRALKPSSRGDKKPVDELARIREPRAPSKESPPPRTPTDAEMLAALQSVAPDLWNPDAPKPLAVGIHKQLYPIAELVRMSRRALRSFLARWTSREAYKRALAEPGSSRVNLDGSDAGEVSEQHREEARQRLTPEQPTG